MNQNVEKLKDWFNKLEPKEKEAVLIFLYGPTLIKEGEFCGPAPFISAHGGLFCGPAPTNNVNVCPQCNRPF